MCFCVGHGTPKCYPGCKPLVLYIHKTSTLFLEAKYLTDLTLADYVQEAQQSASLHWLYPLKPGITKTPPMCNTLHGSRELNSGP